MPGLAVFLAGSLTLISCSADIPDDKQTSAPEGMVISSALESDIEGGSTRASLSQAAQYAWRQMIALNWAAATQNGAVPQRGKPASADQSAEISRAAPRVWETLRAKTEVFPGIGQPHGSEQGEQNDFGYDQSPRYVYDPAAVGSYPQLQPGEVPACDPADADNPPPWIELSETHEVGPEQMYAGLSPVDSGARKDNDQRVLYAVKINRTSYRYTTANGWLDGGAANSNIPATATVKHFTDHHASPPAGSKDLVSFPNGSLQIKSAWRRLSAAEKQSGRFFTALARSYQAQDPARQYAGAAGHSDFPCFVDSEWGLVGIHFKTRTATAPFYIWSTFEHADNIVDENGQVNEDRAGRFLGDPATPPFEPMITSRNAVAADPPTLDSIQKMFPATANADPGKRLYFRNTSGTPTTQGIVAVNRRQHPIAEPVVSANELAHRAIADFLARDTNQGLVPESLLNYKLVGVQWRPVDKPVPGQDVGGDPNQQDEVLKYPSIYYLANLVLETSYRLQNFSGIVQSHLPPPNHDVSVQDLVTDFDAEGLPAFNVFNEGKPGGSNMGGCMGCHGQIQLKGFDFNFVLRRGRVNKPEMDVSIREPLIDMVHPASND